MVVLAWHAAKWSQLEFQPVSAGHQLVIAAAERAKLFVATILHPSHITLCAVQTSWPMFAKARSIFQSRDPLQSIPPNHPPARRPTRDSIRTIRSPYAIDDQSPRQSAPSRSNVDLHNLQYAVK